MLIKNNYGDVIEFKVSRTAFGRPLYLAHFFFIDGLLIDTGPAHTASEVKQAVRNLPVSQVAITHQHEDHTGNSVFFEQNLKVPVYAHPETLKIMRNPPEIQIYRHIMWGAQPPAGGIPLGPTLVTDNYILDVIHTPGHSIDHVSYFEPVNRWLFCGDLFLGEKLTGFMVGENIADHFQSLRKVIALQPKVLFCGLKGRVEHATERLISKYKQWWNIGLQIKVLHEAGLSRKNIIKEVFGGEILFYYFSQSNWGRCYMVDTIIDNLSIFNDQSKNPHNLIGVYS
jgi:glyoxylase-like metal-dependent hydrolase (beta-lactamase superfamily II)